MYDVNCLLRRCLFSKLECNSRGIFCSSRDNRFRSRSNKVLWMRFANSVVQIGARIIEPAAFDRQTVSIDQSGIGLERGPVGETRVEVGHRARPSPNSCRFVVGTRSPKINH